MLQTPDGHARLELTTFHAPTDGPGPAVGAGERHRHPPPCLRVDDAALARLRALGAELVGEVQVGEVQDYRGKPGGFEQSYRLCYVRGPEGIIVELAHELD